MQIQIEFPERKPDGYPKLSNRLVSVIFRMHSKYPDAIVLMQLHGYYLCIAGDAKKVNRVCNIPINEGVCGFSIEELDWIMPKLVRSGHRLAICSELQLPKRTPSVARNQKGN